jgi:hypothetical protein
MFALLIQKKISSEMANAIKTLVFLKRMKGHSKNLKGRTINVIIISMQIINALIVNLVNMLALGQEVTFFSMIKGYVALGFMLNIDDLMSLIIPNIVNQNRENLNESGLAVLSEDNNSMTKVFMRLYKNKTSPRVYL